MKLDKFGSPKHATETLGTDTHNIRWGVPHINIFQKKIVMFWWEFCPTGDNRHLMLFPCWFLGWPPGVGRNVHKGRWFSGDDLWSSGGRMTNYTHSEASWGLNTSANTPRLGSSTDESNNYLTIAHVTQMQCYHNCYLTKYNTRLWKLLPDYTWYKDTKIATWLINLNTYM